MKKSSLLPLFSVLLLYALGLLMVFNTTAASALDKSLSSETHQAFLKQIYYGLMGIGFGCFFYWLGYEKILTYSAPLLAITTVFLVAVFIPKIGMEINGAKRWLSIFGFSFQPSEVAKYLIPIYFIHRVLKLENAVSIKEFFKIGAVLGVPLALILIEPDNGTTAITVVALMVLFVLCKIRWTYWVLPMCVVLAVGVVVAANMPHVPDRIRVYLHPESDLLGKGHQPYQAKIATGSGRVWGRGLGESLQKLNYLPEARSDYIAAIYAEEFGFMGMLGLIGLYMTIAYSGFRIAFRAQDKKGFYLAALITFLLTFQAFLNLGVVSTLLPSKGTTLPFFSLGGTSLFVNTIALFLLLSIDAKKEASYA
jgi:cell division protein FtsW